MYYWSAVTIIGYIHILNSSWDEEKETEELCTYNMFNLFLVNHLRKKLRKYYLLFTRNIGIIRKIREYENTALCKILIFHLISYCGNFVETLWKLGAILVFYTVQFIE